MLTYNLIEYSDIYLKTFVSLWQYYRAEPALNNTGAMASFLANNATVFCLKLKKK